MILMGIDPELTESPFASHSSRIVVSAHCSRTCGEVGVVTTKANIQGKLTSRVTTRVIMGYSVDHSNDVFQMLNLERERIINSRDVIWLGKNFKIWSNTDSQDEKDDIDDDPNDLISKPKKGVKST